MPVFEEASLRDGRYQVCKTCSSGVKAGRFVSVPRLAYANDTWVGAVPYELKDLYPLGEFAIARARVTSVVYKLEKKYYFSRGNACFLPQEPRNLLNILPAEISTLADSVIVIKVGRPGEQPPLRDLRASPLVVRRSRIEAALRWLKQNNPLRADIIVSDKALRQYPDGEGGEIPLPESVYFVNDSPSLAAEGKGYADRGKDRDAGHTSHDAARGETGDPMAVDEDERGETSEGGSLPLGSCNGGTSTSDPEEPAHPVIDSAMVVQ